MSIVSLIFSIICAADIITFIVLSWGGSVMLYVLPVSPLLGIDSRKINRYDDRIPYTNG